MTGKISEDADKVVDGTEKIAAAHGGVNYGILVSSIATFLATTFATDSELNARVPAGAWTAYTPTLTVEAGTALGSGNTLTGKWVQFGKTVHVRILITIGAAGIGGATQLSVSLPTTAAGDTLLSANNRITTLSGTGDIGFAGVLTRALMRTASGGALITANNHVAVVSGSYETA
jgi:hypothetical protein